MPLTIAEQRKVHGQALVDNGALVVNGEDAAHKISDRVHYGQGSRFPEARDLPRDPQADAHAKSINASLSAGQLKTE